MIYYNSNTINDWNFGDDNIIKVYKHGAVCYYKITSGDTPTPVQEPCFAVVDDISQYSDTEFEDVFNKADGKWYKLNNLSQYEEYGVYGSGRTITTYEGKLTIDNNYEYQYSGGSWVNLGEVTGTSITIKSPEYIERTSSYKGSINLNYVWKTNSKMQFKFYSTNNGGGIMIGELNAPDSNDCRMFFAGTAAYFDWGSSRISWSSNGSRNTLYEYEYGNYYIKNMSTSTSKTGSRISTNRTSPLYLGGNNTDYFRTYYVKFYEGNTLVKDFIPWTDTHGNFGLYEKVSNTIYSATSGSFTASSVWNDVEVGGGVEYPVYYDEIQDPPDNVTFTSMTEAESYECPWWGMTGIIDNTDYLFCNTNEWLTKYSYIEVSGDYLCDSGNKYKKMQEYDRNVDGTTSATTNYVKGDLIESGSTDCTQGFQGKWKAIYQDSHVESADCDASSAITREEIALTDLESVEIGNCVTSIGESAFKFCTSLTSIDIPNSVTSIDFEAFRECSSLTSINIPSGVTTIADIAFRGCTSLTSVTIGNGVTSIGRSAFQNCSSLTSITVNATTPPTLGNNAFNGTNDCPIYVPSQSVSAYKSASGWSSYASRILAIPTE